MTAALNNTLPFFFGSFYVSFPIEQRDDSFIMSEQFDSICQIPR